jgi:hypothetical protein
MRHQGVPYRSQWAGLECNEAIVVGGADPCETGSWRTTGFTDPDDYRFWSRRVCGLACLESALDHWEIPHPDRATMLADAITYGVYVRRPDGGVDGLIYAPFLSWILERFGVAGDLYHQTSLSGLVQTVSTSSMAIASVSSEIRWPDRANTRRGGHLVLLHGADGDRVWFHNPSGITGTAQDATLSLPVMERFFAGRGMTLWRPQ